MPLDRVPATPHALHKMAAPASPTTHASYVAMSEDLDDHIS